MMARPTRNKRMLCMAVVIFVVSLLLMFYWTHFAYGFNRGFGDTQRVLSLPASSLLHREDWPGHNLDDRHPSNVPCVVHYLWCADAKKKFQFKDYLSLLSALHILRPLTLVLHYNYLPASDDYDSWFLTLKESLPNLQLKKLPDSYVSCGSEVMLDMMLGFLAPEGGVFLGQGVILTRAPAQFHTTPFSFHFAASAYKTQGVVFAKQGFKDRATRQHYLKKIVSAPATCVSEKSYNEANYQSDVVCLSYSDSILYPKDIMFSSTPFAELARWLFYGKRAPVKIQKDPNNLIPRITHFIKLKGGGSYSNTLTFRQFLGVLSALYVGGFHHVYFHAEGTPEGRWWQELQKENVTWVKIARISSVYSNPVGNVAHVSDVLRFLTLYKYGGAYQDCDVLWLSRVNDSLLACPAVLSFDWVIRGRYPEQINNGVMLSHRHSEWMGLYLETFKDYRDRDWLYNSCFVTYKMFEKYPELVCLERRLQVICHLGICHPAWHENYRVSDKSRVPTPPFTFDDTNAIHVTQPKNIPSLSSPETLKKGDDFFGKIGRMILDKSGRMHLLD
ncbi:uncharacterized protein [Littorina saxatilis]|uniref:uncharacterized protein n=1 Tax=Littorina saxatilis TaxID=31220 RepID=UPI0038B699AB